MFTLCSQCWLTLPTVAQTNAALSFVSSPPPFNNSHNMYHREIAENHTEELFPRGKGCEDRILGQRDKVM